MKKVIFILISIFILIFIIGLGCFIHFKEEQEAIKKSDKLDAEKEYEELISYCNQNHDDIEEISAEVNKIIKDNSTINYAGDIVSQIKNPKWKQLSKQLEISYPEDFNLSYNMVSYHDYSRQGEGPYALYVVYFNESEENIQNYLAGRFISPSRYTKVSNHLYVCLFERQMV